MDIIPLVSSISKIAIGAFVITLVVVGYEVFLLMRRKQAQEEHHEENIVLPDFSNTVKEGTFSPVAVEPVNNQPAEIQSRKISKPFLGMLLGLLVLIVLGVGYLVYRRNQVASVKVDDVTPVSGSGVEPTTTQQAGGSKPLPTLESETDGLRITPFEEAEPTVEPSIEPTTQVTDSAEPTTTATTISTTITPEVTITAGSETITPIPTTLPQAGSYQTTLIVSVMAIAIIYLALIL